MDAKIQELTEKLYQEGIEKGNAEAGKIIAHAREQAQSIIGDAQAQAKQIIADAGKKAADLKQNTEAELRLFASQALEALKSETANLLTDKIARDNVKAATSDATFMQKVILTIAEEWAKKGNILIQTAEAQALAAYFEANAKALLDSAVKIEHVNGKPASFTIAPADGSYKITFGEDEFIEYFKEFLRPQLIEMLF